MNFMPPSLRDRKPQWILSALLLCLLFITLGSLWSYQSSLRELNLRSAEYARREKESSVELQELSFRRTSLLRQKEGYEKLIDQWSSDGALEDLLPSLSQFFSDEITLHHLKTDGNDVILTLRVVNEGVLSEFIDKLRLLKGVRFDRSARRDPAARSDSLYVLAGRRGTP